MLLVDPALIDSIQMNQPPALTSHNITKRVIQEADASINNALSDKMLTPSEQLLYYNQALQKREQHAQHAQHAQYVDQSIPEKISKIEEDPIEEEVIGSVPRTYQNKASLLVKKWKRNGVLGWNKEGNLMYNGEVIPGTNIVDIVNDVVRPRSKNPQPKGWDLVAQGIKATNVPLELIGNSKRYVNQAPTYVPNRSNRSNRDNTRKNDEFHTPPPDPVTPQQLNFETPMKKLSPQQKFKQRMTQRKTPRLDNTWLIK